MTLGDRDANFLQAAYAQTFLMEMGYAVLNPMLTMRLPGCWEIAHDTWIENDLPWVKCADAVLRLPGESKGADAECRWARKWGIPVYSSIDDLNAGERPEPGWTSRLVQWLLQSDPLSVFGPRLRMAT